MNMPKFKEGECEIGGCSCGIWNDWLWKRIEFVQHHPRASEFSELQSSDEIMDAENTLMMELELADELPEFDMPPCERPTCPRFVALPLEE
jgi:hypothetical protein